MPLDATCYKVRIDGGVRDCATLIAYGSQPKLAAWAEENLPEGFAVFAFPEAHRKRLRTSNACENVNGQIKKRPASSASSQARNLS